MEEWRDGGMKEWRIILGMDLLGSFRRDRKDIQEEELRHKMEMFEEKDQSEKKFVWRKFA